MKFFKFEHFNPYVLLFPILFLSIFVACKNTPDKNGERSMTEEGFVPIFNDSTLDEWDGNPDFWRAENGSIIGETKPDKPLKSSTFLVWEGGEPSDFELKTQFRISVDGNSGINYRNEILDTIPHTLRGYQASIDGQNRNTGQNYAERKRTTLAYRGEVAVITSQVNPNTPGSMYTNILNNAWQSSEVIESLGNSDSLRTKIHQDEWNDLHLIIKDNRLQHYINGVLMSEVIDNDSINRRFSGKLGFQLQVGPPMKVEYRNIRLKEL